MATLHKAGLGPHTGIIKELLSKFKRNDYDALKVGDYIETTAGDFCLISKPHHHQPINTRNWILEQTSTPDGEPIIDEGDKVIIPA